MKKSILSRVRKAPAIAVIALTVGASFPAVAAPSEGKVTVVHAVPDLTVDVYANDGLLLEDFAPGTITAPVALAPGEYDVDVKPANSSDVALTATVPVSSASDAAAVAYLDEGGDPTIGLFANNQDPIRKHRARVTVRHTAAAPEVDVRFRRPGHPWRNVTSDLANGSQGTRGFLARTYRFDVVLAGSTTRVLGPVALELDPRMHYYVYAWGSASDDTLALNLSTRRLPASV
jgi:hypothetical protein